MDISASPELRALFDYRINHQAWSQYPYCSKEFERYENEYARLSERDELEVICG